MGDPGKKFHKELNNEIESRARMASRLACFGDTFTKELFGVGFVPESYLQALDKFQKEVKERYSARDHSEEWREWKIKSLLWKHFSGPEYFPYRMPQVYPSQFEPKGAAQESNTSVSLTNSETILLAYISQLTVMKSKAINDGISSPIFDEFYSKKRAVSEKYFPSAGDEWREWYTESSVWGHFFKDSPFPGKEPLKPYDIRSAKSETARPKPARCSRSQEKTSYRSDSPKSPEYEPPSAGNFPNSLTKAKPLTSLPTVKIYQGFENQMQEMARSRGGIELRREFFQYLQKQRDRARSEHMDCNPQFRAWQADSLTWKKFFSPQPFPGKEPVAPEMHHTSCGYGTSGRTSSSSSQQDQQPSPIVQRVKPRDPICPPTSQNLNKPKKVARAASELDTRDEGRLLVYGSRKTYFDCSDFRLKNLAFSLVIDSKKSEVEAALQCEIKINERIRDKGGGLTLQIRSLHSSANEKLLKEATEFVKGWVRLALSGDAILMSTHWSNTNPAFHVAAPSTRPSSMVNSSTQTIETAPPNVRAPISLANPEEDWENYRKTFGATDSDRMIIEAQAKAEGDLRLVLDRETKEVVGLGEFEKRTRLRWISELVGQSAVAQFGKRKAEDAGEKRPEKKNCL